MAGISSLAHNNPGYFFLSSQYSRPVLCRDFWMLVTNSYDTPLFHVLSHYTYRCFSILNFRIKCHFHIEITWMPTATARFPTPTSQAQLLHCTLLLKKSCRVYFTFSSPSCHGTVVWQTHESFWYVCYVGYALFKCEQLCYVFSVLKYGSHHFKFSDLPLFSERYRADTIVKHPCNPQRFWNAGMQAILILLYTIPWSINVNYSEVNAFTACNVCLYVDSLNIQ